MKAYGIINEGGLPNVLRITSTELNSLITTTIMVDSPIYSNKTEALRVAAKCNAFAALTNSCEVSDVYRAVEVCADHFNSIDKWN